ncbi:hypothetical protein SAMN04487773_0932 [Enterobacter sp. kpr-6]|uniref:phage tail tip fiber protein n=1 Tax=Enterobacter sp. kpr-6 TaxID=1761782 RepID=UPI0008EC0BE5|nr:hypothetical protein [Enterobacter sp. kpr-6]SFR00639.1 hypothetical protein SAMN04487773_0932 [Enterobacter sp. kpr-6]
MTLEQRVEALEKKVKVLAGEDFTVEGGRVFINKAFIREGDTTAAQIQAAIEITKADGTTAVRLGKI